MLLQLDEPISELMLVDDLLIMRSCRSAFDTLMVVNGEKRKRWRTCGSADISVMRMHTALKLQKSHTVLKFKVARDGFEYFWSGILLQQRIKLHSYG